MWYASFDLVTNFFTSLGYFDDEAEHEAVVKGFVNALKPGQIACGLSQRPQWSQFIDQKRCQKRDDVSHSPPHPRRMD